MSLGTAVLFVERLIPLVLILIAAGGFLFASRSARKGMSLGVFALVPLLFCFTYVCSLLRDEPLWSADADPYSNFLGYLPYSDAADYYEGARRLLDIGDLTSFSERRPVNAAWLAARLGATGGLAAATLVQVLLVGMAVAYLGFVTLRLFGPWSSLMVVALLYSYSRLFITTTLSEPSGIAFGALGVGLVLLGVTTRNRALLCAGMAALGLGESFRAGAVLAPLGLAAGAVLQSAREQRTKLFGLLAFCYVASLGVSPALNAVYGPGRGQTGANLSYVLAGLSLGGGWDLAATTYADEIAQRSSETEVARFLYEAAASNVAREPWRFVSTVGYSLITFGAQLPVSLGKLVGIDRQLAGSGPVAAAVGLTLLLLFEIGRRGDRPDWPAPLALLFGGAFLVCVPVILLDGGWFRVMAASAPTIFTLLSVSVATPVVPSIETRPLDRIAAISPLAMILALMVAPGVASRLSQSPDVSCLTPGHLVLRHPSGEPSVLYANGGETGPTEVPLITPKQMAARRNFANNPLAIGEPPALLHWAYDYASHRLVTLVAPPGLLETRGDFVWVETAPLGPPDSHRRVERFGAWGGCGG